MKRTMRTPGQTFKKLLKQLFSSQGAMFYEIMNFNATGLAIIVYQSKQTAKSKMVSITTNHLMGHITSLVVWGKSNHGGVTTWGAGSHVVDYALGALGTRVTRRWLTTLVFRPWICL